MEASLFISPHIIPLKPSDSCEAAITFILDAKMALLPVVEQGKLLGYLSAETASENWSKQVKDVYQKSSQHIPAQLNIYDTAKVFLQLNNHGQVFDKVIILYLVQHDFHINLHLELLWMYHDNS